MLQTNNKHENHIQKQKRQKQQQHLLIHRFILQTALRSWIFYDNWKQTFIIMKRWSVRLHVLFGMWKLQLMHPMIMHLITIQCVRLACCVQCSVYHHLCISVFRYLIFLRICRTSFCHFCQWKITEQKKKKKSRAKCRHQTCLPVKWNWEQNNRRIDKQEKDEKKKKWKWNLHSYSYASNLT